MVFQEIDVNTGSELLYKANLQRVGTLIPETITVLSEYLRFKDWDKIKDSLQERN